MKHIYTTFESSKSDHGKYDKVYRFIGWLFLIIVVIGVVLRYVFSQTLSTRTNIITYSVMMLVCLGLFIIRMIKEKVVDWSQIVVIVLLSGLLLIDINDAGGWSAVFSPAAF